METNNEIWKPITGYEGLYKVSNFGRVKSLDHIVKYHNRLHRGYIRKCHICKNGYYMIWLSKNGIKKHFLVHRLVAEAFIPNKENKHEIDHINTIRTDNRVENLRWVDRCENMNNVITKEKISNNQKGRKYEKSQASIPILQYDLNGILVNEWCSITKAVEVLNKKGCSANNICHCLKGIQKTAGGYIWRYK